MPSVADQAARDRHLLAELLGPVLGVPAASAASHDLLSRHATLAAVLSASDSGGANDPAARHLRTIREALHRASRGAIEGRPVLEAYSATIDYLMLTMGQLDIEQLRVLFLNPRNVLIADEVVARGTIDAAPIYPREILKRALDLGATALILAHNHPSGDPRPSPSDIVATKTIAEGGRALGIVLHDHLVLARSGWVSLRAERLLEAAA